LRGGEGLLKKRVDSGKGKKRKKILEEMFLLNSTYFTVGVKNETNFNGYDIWHAGRHTDSRDFTGYGRQNARCY
jgi:hypothetical protein